MTFRFNSFIVAVVRERKCYIMTEIKSDYAARVNFDNLMIKIHDNVMLRKIALT